ncbi:hypothetical protein K435DRAFT_850050 [Dendrothele bispora CBS 962.96]|uniref:Uncharacterized protein n=1 Tax=Dendrothele bispora (strain CBS 962.96) TaxID=1314807 RepID=A0A4S8MQZ1_DENBC|nr:hypothetical protein K435DRAFT_850050 [Dendrothele bispora CBS 962.96]
MLPRAIQSILRSQITGHLGKNVACLGGCRGYRRLRSGIGSTSEERDDRLLRKLEAQLAEAKAKLKEEEQEAEDHLSSSQNLKTRQDRITWFWQKAMPEKDRKQLEEYGIHSVEDLQAVYHEADVAMTSPPFPPLESLEPRLQVAHELYTRIPDMVMQARQASRAAKLKSLFGGLI